MTADAMEDPAQLVAAAETLADLTRLSSGQSSKRDQLIGLHREALVMLDRAAGPPFRFRGAALSAAAARCRLARLLGDADRIHEGQLEAATALRAIESYQATCPETGLLAERLRDAQQTQADLARQSKARDARTADPAAPPATDPTTAPAGVSP
jgi:hypothetical protein